MTNKTIKKAARYISDFYRTAPFAETILILTVGYTIKRHESIIDVGLGIMNSVICAGLTKKQFDLRQRLEKLMDKYGYDKRYFKKTLTEWCDRQTARVVAKNSGHLEDYVKLCEDNKEHMRYSWIKNF